MNLLMAGKFHNVPIINGTNHDETGQIHEDPVVGDGGRCDYTFNIVPNGRDTFPGALSFRNALNHLFGRTSKFPALVERVYSAGRTGVTATNAYLDVKADFIRACRALRVADWISKAGGTLFAYEFNDSNAPNFLTGPFTVHSGAKFSLGAYLGAETQYFFRMPPKVLCDRRYPGMGPGQKSLASAMVTYWTTFAKTGDPNPASGNGPPRWPRYTTSNRQFLSLEPPRPKILAAGTFDRGHKCSSFWNDLIE
jgi:para-nitrobenzyl esterase